jgi:hypothetical protein
MRKPSEKTKKLKIFLSFSGTRSRRVAVALERCLREAFPGVVQTWMSDKIPKGAYWAAELSDALVHTDFGIICLTPENRNAPWILFEAGALTKAVEKNSVCPYLFDMSCSQVDGPLGQFQLTTADRRDTRKLLGAVRRALLEKGIGPPARGRSAAEAARTLMWRLGQIAVAPPDGANVALALRDLLKTASLTELAAALVRPAPFARLKDTGAILKQVLPAVSPASPRPHGTSSAPAGPTPRGQTPSRSRRAGNPRTPPAGRSARRAGASAKA